MCVCDRCGLGLGCTRLDQICTYIHTHVRGRAYTCTRYHTRSHAHAHAHTHAHTHTYIHTHIHTHTHTYTHTHTHIYIYIYIYTYLLTYIHTYIHTKSQTIPTENKQPKNQTNKQLKQKIINHHLGIKAIREVYDT